MTTRRTSTTKAVLVSIVVVVVPACGIPAETEANRISSGSVPFGLMDERQSPATSTTGQEVEVYLVADDKLALVHRFLPAGSALPELIGALSSGPTDSERAAGLSSALPAGQVGDVTASRGVATVDLRSSFGDLGPRDQSIAIAQIVFTLTGRPGIGRVSITLDGQDVEVPRGDGALTTDAVARDDFASIAP